MGSYRTLRDKSLPDNLYRYKKNGVFYYHYKDPRDNKYHGFGTDYAEAIKSAIIVNAQLSAQIAAARIISLTAPRPLELVTKPFEIKTPEPALKKDAVTLQMAVDTHLNECRIRKLSAATMRNKQVAIRALLADIEGGGDCEFSGITVRDIAQVLNKHEDSPSMSNHIRSTAVEVWKDAMREGWTDKNVAEITRTRTYEVKRSRLSLEEFNRIHAVALKHKKKWVAHALELALLTSQRREDLCAFEFKHRADSVGWVEGDHAYFIQRKTKIKVRIPLDASINGLVLRNVIKNCRNNVISKWVIHEERTAGHSKAGDQVKGQLLAKLFAQCRDEAGVTGEKGKNPPSLHEVRSLAIRLYTETYGQEFAQTAAGHKNAKTTDKYRDVRGSEWITARIA